MKNRQTKQKPKNRVNNRFPPQLNLKPVQSRTLRFQASADCDNVLVTRDALLKLVYETDLGGTRGKSQYTGVKLKRVDIWGVVKSSTTGSQMVTVSVEWQGNRGPSSLVSDTGNAYSPAHVSTKPPQDSQAGFWSQVASDNQVRREVLFYLSCPSDSIVDVTYSYVEANGLQAGTPAETLVLGTIVAGPAADGWLINRLDSASITGVGGTGLLIPVELLSFWAF